MKLINNNLHINIPDDLKNFDSYTDEPFIVFEKNNFVDQESYLKLADEIFYLDESYFVKKSKSGKKKFIIEGYNVKKIKQEYLKNFCNALLDKDFFKWFKKTHLPHFNNSGLNLYVYNKNSILFKLFKKFINVLKLKVRFYFTQIEMSSIPKTGYIAPHTDSGKKRLSFVFYIPERSKKLTDEMKLELGTVFWKPKIHGNHIKSWSSSHMTGSLYQEFIESYDVKKVVTFDENKIAGFIKSDISWHSVKENIFDYDRRAIVINLFEIN